MVLILSVAQIRIWVFRGAIFTLLVVVQLGCDKNIKDFVSNPFALEKAVLGVPPLLTQNKANDLETTLPYMLEYGGECEDGYPVIVTGSSVDLVPCENGEWVYRALKSDAGVMNLAFSQTNSLGLSTSINVTWIVNPVDDRVYIGDGSSQHRDGFDPLNNATYSSNVIKLTHSHQAFCALLQSGKVYCWGQNWSNPKNPHLPLNFPTTGFIDWTSHWWYHCGLRNNGDIWCGHLGSGGTLRVNIPNSVKLVGADMGDTFCTLTSDKKVFCSGQNGSGLLGNGTTTSAVGSTVHPVGLSSDVEYLAGGERDTESFCAIKTGGLLYCWGNLDSASLGTTPQLLMTDPLINQVAMNSNAICVLRANNTVACRGSIYGSSAAFTEITNLPTGISSISYCGGSEICIFDAQGKAWKVNGPAAEELLPFSANVSHYRKLSNVECFVHRGQVKCSGENHSALLGLSGNSTDNPTELLAATHQFSRNITGIEALVDVLGGCALDNLGDLSCWGKQFPGRVSINAGAGSTPRVVLSGVDKIIAKKYSSTNFIDVLKAGQVLRGDENGFTLIPWLNSNIAKFEEGYPKDCALFTDGSVQCAGDYATAADLGVAACTASDCTTPHTPQGFNSSMTDLAVGYEFACGIKSSELWCWGQMNVQQNLPVKLTNFPSDLTRVFIDYSSVCALSASLGLLCSSSYAGMPENILNSVGADPNSIYYNNGVVHFINSGIRYIGDVYDGANTILDTGGAWTVRYSQSSTQCKIIGSELKCWTDDVFNSTAQSWIAGAAVTPYHIALDPVPAHVVD